MPSADNLYSADDYDVESFSEELSPTDGYFINRDHPQNEMVPDPSLDNQNSKAQEAREEAQANSESHIAGSTVSQEASAISPLFVSTGVPPSTFTPTSPTTYTPRSPTSSHRRQDDLYSETSPLLHFIPPPPAYSVATSPPTSQNITRQYHTVSAEELEAGIHEPESMGRPGDYNERTPLWTWKVRKLPWRTYFRNILFIALVLSTVIGLIVAASTSGESKRRKFLPPGNLPSSGPTSGHKSYCSSATLHSPESMPTYELKSGDSLVVLQVTDENIRGPARVSVAGEIIVRRLPEDKRDQKTGYITLDVWLSDPRIRYSVEMDSDMQAMKVITPAFVDLSAGSHHCLSIEITAWVPPKATFKTVVLEATELSLRMFDDIDMYVSEDSKFVTVSGDIHFPTANGSVSESIHGDEYGVPSGPKPPPAPIFRDAASSDKYSGFSSPKIIIGTTSGSVIGTFELYDALYIESSSGNIDITVIPQPDLVEDPKPAQLTLATASGYITARLPIRQPASIPARDYYTRVSTHSGNIHGDYVIGSEAIFKAVSGFISLFALPTTYDMSKFETYTDSGSTTVTVLPPRIGTRTSGSPPEDFEDIGDDDPYRIGYPSLSSNTPTHSVWDSKRPLSHLASAHEGSSGNMKIQYPSVWEGEIEAQTISGNIKVGGEKVRIIKDGRKNWAYREVVARKGMARHPASTMRVHEVSGNIDVWVGDSWP